MKKLILIILLGFLGFLGYGQNYLLNSRNDIINEKGQPFDEKAIKTNNAIVSYLIYTIDTEVEVYYLDKSGFCISYIVSDKYQNLTPLIKGLNNSYLIVGKDSWEYYSKNYVYTAKLYEHNETNFKVVFGWYSRDLNKIELIENGD